MDNRAFAYGGKHFVPVRKFEMVKLFCNTYKEKF